MAVTVYTSEKFAAEDKSVVDGNKDDDEQLSAKSDELSEAGDEFTIPTTAN